MLKILSKLSPGVQLILSFAAGALLVFLVMYFGVVAGLSGRYQEVKQRLEDEPGKLLRQAQKHFANGDYDKAQEALEKLSDKHPDSEEAEDGKGLAEQIESTVAEEEEGRRALDERWQKAEEEVKDGWKQAQAAFLRKELERRTAQLERNLDEILDQEWQRVRLKVKKDWEDLVVKRERQP